MKCPRCGAEINPNSKFCESCGSQISYQMQREQEMLNIKGCPRCNSSNVQFRRENQGELRGKKSKQVIHRTVGICRDCGYTWYADSDSETRKTSNKTWWILGWIFCFPIPLTILIWSKKNTWSKPVKIVVTAVLWLVILIIGFSNNKTSSKAGYSTSSKPATIENNINDILVSSQSTDNNSTSNELLISPGKENNGQNNSNILVSNSPIEDFVTEFNRASTSPLILIESFTPSDNKGSHYRVEFRLNAYQEAMGKSYYWKNQTVDIISREDWGGKNYLRIYMIGSSFDDCLEMVRIASPIMDKTITDSVLQETLNYLREHRSANGYYYSNLGLVLSGNDLMMKMKGD